MKIFSLESTIRFKTRFYDTGGALISTGATAAIIVQRENLSTLLSEPMVASGSDFIYDWDSTEEGRKLVTLSAQYGDLRIQKKEVILIEKTKINNY